MSTFDLYSILDRGPEDTDTDYRPPPIDTSHDAPLYAIFDAPLALGEPTQIGYARKEHQLRVAFGELAPPIARAMFRRLSNPQPRDALAARFARLAIERRVRLLGFLADARRRAAQIEAALVRRR